MNLSGKFQDAMECMEKLRHTTRAPGLLAVQALMLALSERFYVPEKDYIIKGRLFDSSLKELIKLPFDIIAVLHPVILDPNSTNECESLSISLAFSPEVMKSQKCADIFSQFDRSWEVRWQLPGFCVTSINYIPYQRMWIPSACMIDVTWTEQDGIYINPFKIPALEKIFDDEALKKMTSEEATEAMNVINLCAMLGLNNVSTRSIRPDAKLNKSRLKKGKNELSNYHVLVIDGEAWDSPPGAEGGRHNDGYRSHMRRGHIRRIGDGKLVWVRSCLVHGKKSGFIEKDYRMGS